MKMESFSAGQQPMIYQRPLCPVLYLVHENHHKKHFRAALYSVVEIKMSTI